MPTDDNDSMQPTINMNQSLLSEEEKLKITLEEQFRLKFANNLKERVTPLQERGLWRDRKLSGRRF